jgi:3-isopropylmalate dehydrogenase
MNKPEFRIAVLPGDGIGPEVTDAACRVLDAVGEKFGAHFVQTQYLIGGEALRQTGKPLPEKTLQGCLMSDAVLLGAVGAPEFDKNPPSLKPETALLQLRQNCGAFANLRPAIFHAPLLDVSPLKREVVEGADILIVRELTGGLYFGEPRGIIEVEPGVESAFNTLRYNTREITRIAEVAFQAARKRHRILHSVDKANVLETSQLWRKVVTTIAANYPDVSVAHMYVDNCAMQLVAHPRQFDVIVTENLFGDILSDEASMITGSIGMLPSASIGGRVAIYEPVHGSAPNIAGKGIANPLAAIASVAMMLRYSFSLETEATAVEQAIASVLERGDRTFDLASGQQKVIGTAEMTEHVIAALNEISDSRSLI